MATLYRCLRCFRLGACVAAMSLLGMASAHGQDAPPRDVSFPETQQATPLGPVTESRSTPDTHSTNQRVVRLYSLSSLQLEAKLSGLFRSDYRIVTRDVGTGLVMAALSVHSQGTDEVRLRYSEDTLRIVIMGTPRVVQQAAQLITALDQTGNGRGGALVVRRGTQQHARAKAMSFEPPDARDDGFVRPAQHVREVAAAESADSPIDPQLRQRLRDLGEDVQVEVLPDLDVIILRGRDRDIDELAKIIEQMERLAVDAQPRIEIFHLRHVRGSAVSQIIDAVSEQYTGGRQGRVSVTALGKPNALLIIGWGSAIEATIELIQKLDQPVAAGTQLDVIPLRHAAAATAAATVQQFLAGREGLGPEVIVTPEPRTNALIIHAAPRDVQEIRRIVKQLDARRGAAAHRLHVFELENSLATDIATILQNALDALQGGVGTPNVALEMLLIDEDGERRLRAALVEGVRITPNPGNNTLVVSAPPDALNILDELIRRIDTQRESAQIKVFHIEHGDAVNLVQVLRTLLLADGLMPQLPNAAGEISFAPLRFSVDQRINSIIASGPEGDLQIVDALLVRLDQKDARQRRSVVYQLKNSPAADVATTINQFMSNQRLIEQAVPGTENPYQRIEKEVVVVPEPVNNKLVLSATPRYFDELNEMIQRLDEAPPQVVIQVLIGEVALGNTHEFGVELGLQDSVLFDRGLIGDLLTTTNSSQRSTADGIVTVTEEIIRAATNTPGFNFNNTPLGNSASDQALENSGTVAGQGLSHFTVGRTNANLGFGGLVLSASSESVNILLRALQESRRVDILSRPQIRTLDNQPAFIQVGQRVPRIVSSAITQFGQTNAIDFDDVGLILGVTPRISPDNTVVMEIDAEKSKVSAEAEGVPISSGVDGTVLRAPVINTTRAQTTISAASGETVVMAGLITKDVVKIHRGVPYLSNIPLLGNLFRYDGTECDRTELLIIMTPHVIRTPEDSARLKQMELARMSWCAADVYDLQGDINYQFNLQDQATNWDEATEVVYPDGEAAKAGLDANAGESSVIEALPPLIEE